MEMQTPDGAMRMWFAGEYREVVENERLVYTEAMSDEHGNVKSAAEIALEHHLGERCRRYDRPLPDAVAPYRQ